MPATNDRPPILLVNRCFVQDREGRVLLVKRTTNDRHNPGLWEAPGGKLEQGEDVLRALETEVLQETGLLVEPTERFVYADSSVIAVGKYTGFTYLVLFCLGRIVGGNFALSHEHEDFAWVTYDEALTYELAPETRKAACLMEKHLKPILQVA